MNHQTDDKLITGAFVITASDDDGLIHQPHCQDFIDSAHNKKFFLFTKGQGVSPTSIRVNIRTTGLLYFDGAEVGLKNAHSKDINGVGMTFMEVFT
ncbi:hypothetical protein H6G33_08135 [Calothrix sp. FACHB-1219]|uniref:hypothetical protein n=1 Tax=unclassified Calothrix TaxID=2619626 RepID=UPI0016832788|nr:MULTISPECIES: hypothetical protein [unclassified Calothrix]MBD2201962.1 hypothetical protein [Calothrix sp. FACHB-168]MBD2216998.1 hypothetical protein [Calothrix sp. FACHB-1219]